MLKAHDNGLGNQVTAMPVVTDAGTYAIATLMAKWPPVSSLLVISIQRGAVLPNRLIAVMQLSEHRSQPIPITSEILLPTKTQLAGAPAALEQ